MTLERPYSEGDMFAVPLAGGGFGVGLIARASPPGVVIGYFFGDSFDEPPPAQDLAGIRPEHAIFVKAFGDLALIQRDWPVLGRLSSWNREDWPMPAFGREEPLTGRLLRVEYPDDDPSGHPRETVVSEAEYRCLPADGLAGFQLVEDRLSRLIGGSP